MEPDNELLALEKRSPEQLAEFVNELIEKDFSQLVQLLYRLDVSEEKIKHALTENPASDAGTMIAALLIERMQQSRLAREAFRPDSEIPEEERW
ncbi:hypothetical protein [Sediminibacterium soli]|uniref:hypothetical protein n=1 Tax=Sediminibacterium soli TaxID=2698829 RepID=UPI001379ADE7|nr:hypothetical protein [Sediminibacterium soli]NCI47678.1 hypothetical protein [Sediminibacterium soli]